MKERTDVPTGNADATVEDRLAEMGISVYPSGAVDNLRQGDGIDINLGRSSSEAKYRAVRLDEATLSAATHLVDTNLRRLVIGEHVGPRTANAFRAAGIDYADRAGNAHIEFGGVYVDVQGRKRLSARRTVGESSNLFSARRLQVVFILLAWPEFLDASVREVAYHAGVSVGLAQSTLRRLVHDGYISDGGVSRRELLVDLWVAGYRGSLLPKLLIAGFDGDVAAQVKNPEGGDDLFLSGEFADTTIRNPQHLVLYTESMHPMLPVLNRWQKSPYPAIEVRKKFWKEPSTNNNETYKDGFLSVPRLLVYADLLAAGESRLDEVAEGMRGAGGF